jgi:hypothetical protein
MFRLVVCSCSRGCVAARLVVTYGCWGDLGMQCDALKPDLVPCMTLVWSRPACTTAVQSTYNKARDMLEHTSCVVWPSYVVWSVAPDGSSGVMTMRLTPMRVPPRQPQRDMSGVEHHHVASVSSVVLLVVHLFSWDFAPLCS